MDATKYLRCIIFRYNVRDTPQENAGHRIQIARSLLTNNLYHMEMNLSDAELIDGLMLWVEITVYPKDEEIPNLLYINHAIRETLERAGYEVLL